jgi:leucyl aminopeptidase
MMTQVRLPTSLVIQAKCQIAWPELQYQDKVKSVTKLLSKDEMRNNLANLTSFHNRYYRSEFGVKSSRWLYDQILDVSTIR